MDKAAVIHHIVSLIDGDELLKRASAAELVAALREIADTGACLLAMPDWTRWPRVWAEPSGTDGGDCLNTIKRAWRERYGESLDLGVAVEKFVYGDMPFYYLMPGGRAVVYANESAILEAPPAAPPAGASEPCGSEEESAPDAGLFDLPSAPPAGRPALEWTSEQRAVLGQVEEWGPESSDFGGQEFISLTGPAGSGKSTLVREIVERYPSATLTAMTGKAALRLSECAGRHATTLHKVLYWPPKPGEDVRFTRLREPPSNFVTVDESSMLSPQIFADLQKWASQGVRVLLVGDDYQLPPVISGEDAKRFGEDYSVFSHVRGARLETVMRSAGGVLRAATRVRESGQICRESDLDGSGDGYEFVRHKTPVEYAVDAYCEDSDDHFLITWRNEVRMAANKLVRARLGREGPLPDEGEPILIKRNGQGLLNGEIVECGGLEAGPVVGSLHAMWLRLRPSGERVLVSVDGGRDGEIFDGGSPRVENWKKYHADLAAQGLSEPLPVTWGYVLTVHSAQGGEARRVTVFLCRGDEKSQHFNKPTTLPSGATAPFSARWGYTGTTRARNRAALVVGR